MARPTESDEKQSRRSVVPDAAGHSVWTAAIWTGAGTAIVCAIAAIIVVAICWLPVSGTTGRITSTIHAGLLTFLASVHGGLTVDGVAVAWLPLGMLLIVALAAWRAGGALADVTTALDERDPARLALAGAAQAGSFAAACLILVPVATLGTSRAPFFGVALAALIAFGLPAGIAFVRDTALRGWCAARTPAWLGPCLRCGAAAVAVYLAAGAILVAVSLAWHHGTVEMLSRQVGGGWGGVPVLVLGVLAAPNAAVAGASYLAGPGFAVGSGTTVTLFDTAHGTLPAFPVVAAIPTGHGANPVVWGFAAVTTLCAGIAVARLALRARGWWVRLGRVAGGAVSAGALMFVLGWQAGGALGDGRLHAVGPSPWLLGGVVTGLVVVAAVIGAALVLGIRVVWRALGIYADERRADDDDGGLDELFAPKRKPRLVVAATDPGTDDRDEDGELAG